MHPFNKFFQKDLNIVLFNTNERAVKQLVNGAEMTVIIDDEKLAEMKLKSQYADAIYNAGMLLFIRSNELGYRPAIESIMTIGEREYNVMQVSGDALLQIVLEAPR